MTDSELDPHVLISCRVSENPKIIDLPNDRARWGWVILMGKAKLQRPPGRFASLRVAAAVLGDHRRFLDDYLRVGILEPETNLCADCALVIPPDDRRPEGVAVHDWTANQSRTQRWRRRVGLTSGHGNLNEDDGETDGETPGKPLRAGARAVQSQSQSMTTTGDDGEGGPGGTRPDPAVSLHHRTGTFPTPRVLSWLDELANEHGESRVADAIDAEPLKGRPLPEYLRAIRDSLRMADHNAERAERDAEKARLAEKRRHLSPLPTRHDVSPEEADRIAREYRATVKGTA